MQIMINTDYSDTGPYLQEDKFAEEKWNVVVVDDMILRRRKNSRFGLSHDKLGNVFHFKIYFIKLIGK